MKARRRRNFLTEFVTVCTQIMNGIVNAIEIQEREKSAAGEFFRAFDTFCTQIMNGIVNEIERE